jgi:GNAT superfamily N-acetyltransferase
MMEFEFSPCQREDIPRLTEMFDEAAAFQERISEQRWMGFEIERLESEIEQQQIWKLVDGDQIACVFVWVTSDEQIWENSENDRAIYLHRIAVTERYRGKGCMQAILEWSKALCIERGWDCIRVDTWARNEMLVGYYIQCGFRYIREIDPADIAGLPAHYGQPLALLQLDVEETGR